MKIIKTLSMLLILGISSNANAVLIDNGTYTTDTDTGLDWLDLTLTDGLIYSSVESVFAADGWQYATNAQVENLFSITFDGYYDTNTAGYSVSYQGSYSDQTADANAFISLFGTTESNSYYDISYGLYLDENNNLRMMGAGIHSNGYDYVYGTNYYGDYNPYFNQTHPHVGTYLVRNSSNVAEPSSILLFGSAIFGIAALRRRKSQAR